jgi:RNA polymerase sigma factor (sigma-70 family)
MVKAVCRRILREETLAEDAAQEVFLLLVRKLPSLPPQTILGGWLYVTACHLARTHQRTDARRLRREQVMEHLMNPAQDTLWDELEPLLDDAMLTLSPRQRELVLFRYFHNNSQRAAAALVGCSESVASRELSAAIEILRKFFARHGVTLSGTTLVALLTTHAAQASIGATIAASLYSASALASSSASPLLLTFMKTTTTTKILAGAAALVIAFGAVHQLTQKSVQTNPTEPDQPTPAVAKSSRARGATETAATPLTRPTREIRSVAASAASKPSPVYDEAALKIAREKQAKFFQRMGEIFLMGDTQKARELLLSEYGINLAVEEIRQLQERGQKGFTFGVIELWASRQPREALAWAASALVDSNGGGGDFHQVFLDAARKGLPNLNRDMLAAMLPEAPGTARMLDLAEATSDPASLAARILAETDPAQRAARLRMLAQGWSNSEAAADWARQNLSGTDKTAFYSQVGYNLAHQNPQAALQVLSELQGTDAYASTFGAMMRGLVQEGGRGKEAAELIAQANLKPEERAELISELSRRWVRNDADAAISWVNSLTAPEDFRAAIPLLVSQLDSDRVSRTVEAYLKSHDPVMEQALIEAAAPTSLMFDPKTSHLILDPLINQDPATKLRAGEGNGSSKEEMLWNSVNMTARRQAEDGEPAAALEWLATLPFADQGDYVKAATSVLTVWNLKSETEAATCLQNSSLSASLKSDLQKTVSPQEAGQK